MEQYTKDVGGPRNSQEAAATLLEYQLSTLWALLPAMHGRFGAPLGGEAADCLVDIFAEAQEIADDATVQEGAVGVGVCEVGGHQIFVPELLENYFGHEKLFIR